MQLGHKTEPGIKTTPVGPQGGIDRPPTGLRSGDHRRELEGHLGAAWLGRLLRRAAVLKRMARSACSRSFGRQACMLC